MDDEPIYLSDSTLRDIVGRCCGRNFDRRDNRFKQSPPSPMSVRQTESRLQNYFAASRMLQARLDVSAGEFNEARRNALWLAVCVEVDLRFPPLRSPRQYAGDDPKLEAAVIAYVNHRTNGGSDEWEAFRQEFLKDPVAGEATAVSPAAEAQK